MITKTKIKNVLFLLLLAATTQIGYSQSGTLEAVDGVILGNAPGTTDGTIRYTGADFEGRKAGVWSSLTGGGSVWSQTGADAYYNAGDVGVGTAAPQVELHVDGSAEVLRLSGTSNPWMSIRNTPTSPNYGYFNLVGIDFEIGVTGFNNMIFKNANSERFRIDGNGNFGIGSDTPSQKFHVKFSGSDGIRVEGDGTGDARAVWLTNTGGGHFIYDDNSDAHALKVESSNDLAFNTDGNTERMRIDDTGNVAINTAPNTNARLKVAVDSDLYGLEIDASNAGTVSSIYGHTDSNGAQTKYGIRGNIVGNTGTGNSYGIRGFADTAAGNFYAVYSAGNLHYTGTLTNSSDERLKKNIQNLTPVLSKVMQLETKTYEFDHEKYPYANFAHGPQIGFIAQNVQTQFPSIVKSNSHSFDEFGGEVKLEMLGMSTMEMVPILTKAIQEQQALIEAQQDQINALIKSNKEILARLN